MKIKVKSFNATLTLLLCCVGVSNASAQTKRSELSSAQIEMRARRVEPHMRAAAARYGVDPRVLWTIAYLETRFRSGLVSPKGARGMMQFMPGTAARYGLADPHDDLAAIHAAARYVRDLSRRFDNRLDLVLAGYNAGEGAVEAFLKGTTLRLPDGRTINARRIQTGGVPPYTETRNYVTRGLYVARQITVANVFSPTSLSASYAFLKSPPTPTANKPTKALAADTAPLVLPSSSYASAVVTDATRQDTQPSPAPEEAPTTAVRSFRAAATSVALPEHIDANRHAVSTVTSQPGVTPQPRSIYTAGAGRQP